MGVFKICILIIIIFLNFQEAIGTAAYSYCGSTGPYKWSGLDATYTACASSSTSQSPIDITGASTDTSLGAFTISGFDSTTGTHTVENNGHTLKVSVDSSASITVTGGSLTNTYKVSQFHFHWGSFDSQGSEHAIGGVRYPMELHIVTYDSTTYANIGAAQDQTNGLAVLGFFFEIDSSDNSNYASLISKISSVTTNGATTSLTSFALSSLFPSSFTSTTTITAPYWRYSGSLTTPSCYESVIWTVFQETIKISSTQLATFRTIQDSTPTDIVDNFRPIQSLGSRTIKFSGTNFNRATTTLTVASFLFAVVARF